MEIVKHKQSQYADIALKVLNHVARIRREKFQLREEKRVQFILEFAKRARREFKVRSLTFEEDRERIALIALMQMRNTCDLIR